MQKSRYLLRLDGNEIFMAQQMNPCGNIYSTYPSFGQIYCTGKKFNILISLL